MFFEDKNSSFSLNNNIFFNLSKSSFKTINDLEIFKLSFLSNKSFIFEIIYIFLSINFEKLILIKLYKQLIIFHLV